MLSWPSIAKPVWGGQPQTQQDQRVTTPTEAGYVRTRRRSALTPTIIEGQWHLSNDDYDILRHFVDVGLRGASESFLYPVKVGSGFIDHECLFVGYPKYNPSSPGRWMVSASILVKQNLGLPVFRELSYTDANDGALTVGTISDTSHSTWRCEIYVRTAVNAGTTATLKVGHTTDDDAYVTAISVAAAGTLVIVDSHGNDGALLGTTDNAARTITATLATTGTAPTEGDLSVALFWRP